MREAEQAVGEADSPVPGVKRPVFILGIVSFLTDVSSEMVYPLVPLFLPLAIVFNVAIGRMIHWDIVAALSVAGLLGLTLAFRYAR